MKTLNFFEFSELAQRAQLPLGCAVRATDDGTLARRRAKGRKASPAKGLAPSGKAANRPRPTSKLSADRQAFRTLLASCIASRCHKGKRAPIESASLPLAFAGQGRCQCKPSAISKPSGGQARRGAGPTLLPGQARCHKGKRAPIASDCGGGDRPPKGSKHQLCWSRALS